MRARQVRWGGRNNLAWFVLFRTVFCVLCIVWVSCRLHIRVCLCLLVVQICDMLLASLASQITLLTFNNRRTLSTTHTTKYHRPYYVCVVPERCPAMRNIIILRSWIRMHKHTIKYAGKPMESATPHTEYQTHSGPTPFPFREFSVLQRKQNTQKGARESSYMLVFSLSLYIRRTYFCSALRNSLFKRPSHRNRSHARKPPENMNRIQQIHLVEQRERKLGLIENSVNCKSICMYNDRVTLSHRGTV